jgi:hypothetical protein
LARNIELEALGDEPISFTPNSRGEGTLHNRYSAT